MRKKELRDLIFKLFGETHFQSGAYAVLYGSEKGRDIDVLLVQEDRIPTQNLLAGQTDFFIISKSNFDMLLGLLDPVVVDPVLSGEIILGDSNEWYKLRKQIKDTSPETACSEHAVLRSLEESLSTNRIWCQYQNESDPVLLEWAFQNLSFAISYLSFARRYSQPESKTCTLSTLINHGQILLPDFWEYRASIKSSLSKPDSESVKHWIGKWFSQFYDNKGGGKG